MKVIIGLGNPGDKFKYTRHNIGFMVVEKLVKNRLSLLPSQKAWKKEEKFSSEMVKLDDCLVVKPYTFMNLSGLAVTKIVGFYKLPPSDVWVVHDDIDLPLGKIRIRKGGASAGHRGVDSIIDKLGTADFVRFRLGIGRGKLDPKKTTDQNLHRREVEKYVISLFRDYEAGELKKMIKKTVEALELALDQGIERAMNRFN